jgi:hypothetical protein
MHVGNDLFDEETRVWVKVHDPQTNTNCTAELYGRGALIGIVLLISGRLMDAAGFVPGWCAGAKNCGTIPYFVLFREAVERCWAAPYA